MSNPYEAPESNLEDKLGHAALDRATRGAYKLSARDVINDAWILSLRGGKAQILVAVAVFLLALVVTNGFLYSLGIVPEQPTNLEELGGYWRYSLLSVVLLAPILAPLEAGLLIFPMKMALNRGGGVTELFAHYDKVWPLAVASLLSTFAQGAGALFLLVPGIDLLTGVTLLILLSTFLRVGLVFTLPLVAIFDLSPVQAMSVSFRTVRHRWFTIFTTLVILLFIACIGFVPFIVGFIFTIPMLFFGLASVFLRIFGTSWANDK